MKAISIYAPYGTLIACGIKRHETRSWSTEHRGLIAIHQGKTWADADIADALLPALKEAHAAEPDVFNSQILQEAGIGAVVAVARLVDCVPADVAAREATELDRLCGDFRPGRWAWRLEEVQGFKVPIRVRGQQGLFDVEESLLRVGVQG